MDYDADIAPNAEAWLSLGEQDRISIVMRAHKASFPDALHTADANPVMHGSLHAIVETQVASASPAITGETLARLLFAGLKRHVGVHAIMQVLASHIAALLSGSAFDHAAYAADLAALQPDAAVGQALRQAITGDASLNRAQRRAQKNKPD